MNQQPTDIQQWQQMLMDLEKQPENLAELETLAESGNTEVMYILGWCYFKGEYLPKDLDRSLYWLEKAKAAGHERAEGLLVYATFFRNFYHIHK